MAFLLRSSNFTGMIVGCEFGLIYIFVLDVYVLLYFEIALALRFSQ